MRKNYIKIGSWDFETQNLTLQYYITGYINLAIYKFTFLVLLIKSSVY